MRRSCSSTSTSSSATSDSRSAFRPERTIYDLVQAGAPLDHEKLDRHLIDAFVRASRC